jgi:hypothetical protein
MARTKKESIMQSSEAKVVMQTLVVRPAKIESADINTWREAVNSAKKGLRTKLYDLYENLLSDPILSNAVERRVNAIANAEITFQKDGDSVEEIDDLIDTPEFEELVKEIILHKAWGKSVIEVSFSPKFDVFSFPRKHIKIAKLDKPLQERKKYIVSKESDLTGYEYSDDEYIIECGKDDELGFLYKAAPFVIYKRGDFGDWAEFAEVFGMPFLVGKYPGYDSRTRDQLFESLTTMGSRSTVAVPKETELEVQASQSSGSNTLFKDLRAACNEEILIAVLGNTMTTINGSSKSQAEVHAGTQKDIANADRRYVQRTLNRYLQPLLLKRGYPVEGGFFAFPDQGESLTTNERLDLALKLKNDAKVAVDDDYFYEISGIPKAESNDPETKPDPDPEPDDPKEDTEPTPAQKKKGLKSFFVEAPAPTSGAKRQGFTGRLVDSITGRVKFDDKYSINIAKLVDEALREIYGNDYQQLVNARLFDISNSVLQHALTVEFDNEGSDWGQTNKDFINEFRINTAVFNAFKNHQQTSEIVGFLIDEKGELRSFSQFKKLALQVSEKYNINWLQTEYNTAVRTARAAINFRKYLANEKIYPNLEYLESTASDKRGDHLDYVGTILPIRHEWWKIHLPPSEWNCQCGVKPTNKETTGVPEEGEPINPVFENNPGETAKPVNTEETAYFKNTAKEVRDQVAEFGRRAERIRQRLEELKFKRKSFKSGGYIDIPKSGQNKKEEQKNLKVYGHLAMTEGGKYALLPVSNSPGVKNPDAINLKTYEFSDAKIPTSPSIRNAIQNSIKSASAQKVTEVVIYFDKLISSREMQAGLKAALQEGRAKTIRQITIVDESGIRHYDADELRELFK